MGELLRAVCDATALDSNPAFYTGRLEMVLPPAAPVALTGNRSVFIECKPDTWFLMMGWAQSSARLSSLLPFEGAVVWDTKSAATTFAVRDVKSSRLYSPDLVQKVDANFNLNNFVTLPEYVLWEPSSVIEIIQNVPITNTSPTLTAYNNFIVTLAGIEYKLPSRPGGYLNGR